MVLNAYLMKKITALRLVKHTVCLLCLTALMSCLSIGTMQAATATANDSVVSEAAPVELSASGDSVMQQKADSLVARIDSLVAQFDTLKTNVAFAADSLRAQQKQAKERFIPDPKRAMWLAMVIPGGGQIYNRKYWKLPLIYGGFIGCVYAMTWNNTMYRDYSQAYIDIMDNDENTKSYENFLPPTYDVNANMDRLKDLFKRRKNYYRRYRDLSMFCMIGVYALSILDAYIDAEMSSFDISDDLTLKVKPAIMNERNSVLQAQGVRSNSYGVQCSFNF